MIRKLQKTDIKNVADIWLKTNIEAHNFIPSQYWKANFEAVKEMLVQTEVYIYEDENKIQGFVGLTGDYIEGIFILCKAQSSGIGQQLLEHVKDIKNRLSLSVYQKNTRAVKFYQREGFEIQYETTDKNTSEKEYFMLWTQ